MPQISKKVRDSIKTQLSASVSGFNARLAALASTYGVTAFTIDWASTSTNFLYGRVPPDLIEESSPLTYPLLTIDTVQSQHTNRVKFATFAGPVTAVVEVHLSWSEDGTVPDFASLGDAVEDAVVSCLNDQAYQTWPGNVLWNGQVTATRGPIMMAGENWRQTIQFICNFEVVA